MLAACLARIYVWRGGIGWYRRWSDSKARWVVVQENRVMSTRAATQLCDGYWNDRSILCILDCNGDFQRAWRRSDDIE